MKEFVPLLVSGIGICFLCAVYLYLICPHIGKNPMRTKAFRYHFAHRGLHSASVPENSLSAFHMAAEQGYGIELDVRLTQDNHPVIFHDENAFRMCGIDKRICDMTLNEIRAMRLLQTNETVPTLQEALQTVNGKVPLLIELKSSPCGECRRLLVDSVLDALQSYPGKVCLESFDPRMMYHVRKRNPHIPRGQLVMNGKGLRFFLLSRLLVLFLSRPHVIACEKHCVNLTTLTIARLFHPVMISWTIRSAAEWHAVNHRSDLMVFEAFLPQAGILSNHPRNLRKRGINNHE